jgi:hypothetical protein
VPRHPAENGCEGSVVAIYQCWTEILARSTGAPTQMLALPTSSHHGPVNTPGRARLLKCPSDSRRYSRKLSFGLGFDKKGDNARLA